MKNRRSVKLVLSAWCVALLAGLAVGASVQAAYAYTVASSDSGYYTVAGHQYRNNAYIFSYAPSSHSALAQTYTQWSTPTTAAGYAGSKGRLFTSSGSMSCEGTIIYNTGQAAVGSSCTRTTAGAWYSYGVSYGFNGSGYSPFYTFLSPSLNS